MRSSNWRWHALAAAPAVVLLAFQATSVWPFFSDDSFISLRFAERLLDGHGLTFTDAPDGTPEYVEGYSNLLWVLLTAMLGALGIELVTAARLLGAIATVAALYLLARAERPRDANAALLAAVPPLLVASTQCVAVWTLAGLEGPLLLALLAWGFAGIARATGDADLVATWPRRRLLLLGVPFALACWTRPDGPIWALTAGIGIAAMVRDATIAARVRRAFWFGLPALAAVAAQLGFRVVYYGDYVPNTAHVKAEFDPQSLAPGFAWLGDALLAMPGTVLLALVGAALLAACARPRAFVLTLLLPVLAWFAYVAAIGGDHFPGYRLMHGVLAPLALLGGLGLRALADRVPGRLRTMTALAIVLATAAAGVDVFYARTHPKSIEARHEVWEWRDKVIGETLRDAFGDRSPLLAVEAAGALPYYSELPVLDLLGLCDRTIATTPFPAWLDTVVPGVPRPPGHLRGNGDYAIGREPDLMLFKQPLPTFVSGCEFESDPRFLDGYRCVLVDLGQREILPGRRPDILVPLWVRVDGRVGIERTADRLVVPAFLFGSLRLPGPVINRYQPTDPQRAAAIRDNGSHVIGWLQRRRPTATPTGDGRLALHLDPEQGAELPIELPAGDWRVRVEPADCGATAAFDGPKLRLRAADQTAYPISVVLERN